LLLLQLRVTVREPKTKEVTKGRNSDTTSPPPLQCRKRLNPHQKPILFLCAKPPPKTEKKEGPDLVQRRRREPIKPRHTQVRTDELDLNKKGTSPITPTSEALHGHTKKRTKKGEKKCKQKASKRERKGTHNAETGSEAPPEEAGAAPASDSSTHFFCS